MGVTILIYIGWLRHAKSYIVVFSVLHVLLYGQYGDMVTLNKIFEILEI